MTETPDELRALVAEVRGMFWSSTPQSRALCDAVEELLARLATAEAERERFKEHSIMLNRVGWNISVALGRVHEGVIKVEGDIETDLDGLLARLATAEAIIDKARPLLVRYSETRDAALTDDQHRCEALLVSMAVVRWEQP